MDRDTLIDNLFMAFPIVHKKILKNVSFADCTKQQMGLLFSIKKHDNMPMSFYSEKLAIPRSNLTVIADKLFADGLIERHADANDRRVISLKITDKGNKYIERFIESSKKEIYNKLDGLSEEDILLLNESISNILNILSKVKN